MDAWPLLGRRVVLHGLTSRAAWNGLRGTAIDRDEDAGRYVVKLDDVGGIAGNVLLRPASLTEVRWEDGAENAWRAEDGYSHRDRLRVSPLLRKPRYDEAIEVPRGDNATVRLTGGRAKVRTAAAFLATPRSAEQCIRFVVRGAARLQIELRSPARSSVGRELDCLDETNGTEICVALAHDAEGPYGVRSIWMQFFKDGIPVSEPSEALAAQYCAAFPKRTRTIAGVEVVEEYMSGAESEKRKLRTWQGLYLRTVLDSPGASLRMVRQDETASVDCFFAAIHRERLTKALRHAASTGKLDDVREAVSNGADVDGTDGEGMSAVHWACQEDHPDILHYLISETSADLNVPDRDGWPPIITAAEKDHVECVRLLLGPRGSAGGEPCEFDARMDDGTTALIRAEEKGRDEIADLLGGVGATNDPGPRPVGPQFDRVAMEGHRWDMPAACRFARAEDDLEAYPDRWLYSLQRLSEGNYAMLGMAEHGDGPCYVHMTSNDWLWRLRWLPRDYWFIRATDSSIIDTVHVQLQRPRDGSNRLNKGDVVDAAGPDVTALFLHCASKLKSEEVLDLVRRCPNLRVLSLSECNVDDDMVRGIAKSKCAANLIAVRFYLNSGSISSEARVALIEATKHQLQWIDFEAATNVKNGRGDDVNHISWIPSLGACSHLRVALLPRGVPPPALGSLSTCARLEMLSIDGEHTPLSSIESIVRAGCTKLDINGFFLDDSASKEVCAAANRLYIGKGYETFPREKILSCSRLTDIRLRCDIEEGDITECLSELGNLRSLHLWCDAEDWVDPDVISSLCLLRELRCLNLSSCLGNYYDGGEEIVEQNQDALISMAASGLDRLRQLDLSSHHDVFYACIDDYDLLITMACKLSGLRVLNLSENGRKFPWAIMRSDFRCINDDEDHEGGLTIYFGDDVTVWSSGGGAASLNI